MSSNALLVAILLAGCPNASNSDECLVDVDCGGGDVCARDHQCSSPSSVREVTVSWSINGQDANATTCAREPSFELQFFRDDAVEPLAFAPVPCDLGQFFVDKLPRAYTSVSIDGIRVSIANNGTASLDL